MSHHCRVTQSTTLCHPICASIHPLDDLTDLSISKTSISNTSNSKTRLDSKTQFKSTQHSPIPSDESSVDDKRTTKAMLFHHGCLLLKHSLSLLVCRTYDFFAHFIFFYFCCVDVLYFFEFYSLCGVVWTVECANCCRVIVPTTANSPCLVCLPCL